MESTGLFVAAAVPGAALALFVLDRFLLRLERRGWIYYRRTKGATGIGTDIFQEFSPAAQAMKRSLEQETFRKDVRPGTDPPFGIDLESGTARLTLPGAISGEPAPRPGRTVRPRDHEA
ncbi:MULTISPECIES: hypothetical protein [Streptomycetaceae]|uniref:Uncharacterized protein n=1 Tax=Streptantibioticus cattleyicolor (strain ATCC 35852 / DSM 46488 / JCM 4925 / NBRC 14057 / NRRL 8057) TaxID=1003195 RepID=F8JWX5_STREN|nr:MULTISPECIES: hypothetical protein [Streptomycetaceae]AEW93162.1 hypothetical protein SCATT_07910 [Streptantibioticus cattleyicolor NRRL 8057 = DSM 46488]MYS57888.1 hypothetical protein [Streptomyces sp. SID5468]CCB73520.1 protein of unknown function [Streptantibioticus cattleyicolor NRRL 8057 = DSM 46488]